MANKRSNSGHLEKHKIADALCKTKGAIVKGLSLNKRNRRHRRKSNPVPTMVNYSYELIQAAVKNVCASLQSIVECGVPLNVTDTNGYSPLVHAIRNNCALCVNVLLHNGASVDSYSKDVTPPLTFACEMGRAEMCEVLLEHGAKYEYCDPEGYTPLHIAVASHRWSCVDVLLHHGADIRTTAHNGASLIHTLVYTRPTTKPFNDELNLMLRLIQMGIDLDGNASHADVFRGRYLTALELALVLSNMNAAVMLIEAGCSLNFLRVPNNVFLSIEFYKYMELRKNAEFFKYIENKLNIVAPLAVMSRNTIRLNIANCSDLTGQNSGLPKPLLEYVKCAGLKCQYLLQLKQITRLP